MRPASVTDFSQFATMRAQARRDDPAALRTAARQFEALMVKQMLKSARSSSAELGNDLLSGGQNDLYKDMFDQQMAQQLTSGKGLGLADMLVASLQKHSPGAAGGEPNVSGLPLPQPRDYVLDVKNASAQAVGLPTPADSASLRAAMPALPEAMAARVDSASTGTASEPTTPESFVRTLLPHAERAARQLGIPSRVLIAQAALETGWGKHAMHDAAGRPTFNFFGIKADNRWEGKVAGHTTHEFSQQKFVKQNADFRAYGSVEESFKDYVSFLQSNPRYADALRHGGDPRRFVGGLQKAGYATDPHYAQKILRVAEGRTMRHAIARSVSASGLTV